MPELQIAANDIRRISRWMLPLGLPVYFGMRWFSGVGRQAFVAAGSV